jgi:hypothetical protein
MVRTFVIDKPAFATVRGRMAVTLAGVSGFVIISVDEQISQRPPCLKRFDRPRLAPALRTVKHAIALDVENRCAPVQQ